MKNLYICFFDYRLQLFSSCIQVLPSCCPMGVTESYLDMVGCYIHLNPHLYSSVFDARCVCRVCWSLFWRWKTTTLLLSIILDWWNLVFLLLLTSRSFFFWLSVRNRATQVRTSPTSLCTLFSQKKRRKILLQNKSHFYTALLIILITPSAPITCAPTFQHHLSTNSSEKEFLLLHLWCSQHYCIQF